MGFYLNPGNKGFWKSIRSKIYVDKTGLIAYTNGLINTKEKFVCVCRPRRFGKSMTLEMLAAYYSCGCDSADLFKGRKVESDDTFREHLNRYDVIFLNMQQFLSRARKLDMIECLEQAVLEELREVYGELFSEQTTVLAAALEKIYAKTADAAIRQIRDRKYTQALEGYVGEILLVGINYDRQDKNKPHSCVIERVEVFS